MVVSWHFHGRFMSLSYQILYNLKIIIIHYIIFISVSWQIHVTFMLLSWQIHVTFKWLFLSSKLSDFTISYSRHFKVVSWHFHGRFMSLSWGFLKRFHMLKIRYNIFITFILTLITFLKLQLSIYFCMLYLFHFHGSFMALSWQIHVTFMSDSLQLSNYHNSFTISYSYQFHGRFIVTFMLLSWQIHVTFMSHSLQLSNCHNSIYHIHVSFMADSLLLSCYFHGRFMLLSCHILYNFQIVIIQYIIFMSVSCHFHATFMADSFMSPTYHFLYNRQIKLS